MANSAVSEWLRSFGGEKHAPIFTEHGYDRLQKCENLTESDLTKMGVNNDTDRRVLLRQAGQLKLVSNAFTH